jgi:hypothetical protein
MLAKTTHAVLLGSVAALAFASAQAQTAQTQGEVDQEACARLADQLAEDSEIGAEVRAEVENVISQGNVERCHVIVTAWEEEGTLSEESLELVATEQTTERLIVQQEVEVGADVAVYQPPAEVDVDTGTPEVSWSMPRQSVTVDEEAPQITVRQGQPRVSVEVPQPRVTVEIPEPEVIITWPDSRLDMAAIEPMIEVRIPEPTVNVTMPDPIVELTIGGQERESDLVQMEDGRFAPRGATEEDLQPRITINQGEANVSRSEEGQEPEIVFNRAEPVVTYEREEPEVNVQTVGEPEIRVSRGSGRVETEVRRGEASGDEAQRADDAASAADERDARTGDTADAPSQSEDAQAEEARTNAPAEDGEEERD